jgi:hypothetical protein
MVYSAKIEKSLWKILMAAAVRHNMDYLIEITAMKNQGKERQPCGWWYTKNERQG